MTAIVDIRDLTKTYGSGHQALKGVSLQIAQGEILALLGPNGAGKTTMISVICGITNPTSGTVTVAGHDIIRDFRAARATIGLVPQEVALEPFANVADTVAYTRGLFGKAPAPDRIEAILRNLSLWDKRNAQVNELSGGMKRRVLIAKALSHEPRVLFLDEPTAGVDVELRKDMWRIVGELREGGVTIILTTHYIEEAEAIADRVGVINHGQLLLVEDKATLMARMGRKEMLIELQEPVSALPEALSGYSLERNGAGDVLTYAYDSQAARTGITRLLSDLNAAGLNVRDVQTRQSSLEEIFVGLVKEDA
ncbi:ATP-binding cassette domain-containing protein [Rhodobacteraceae bacterium 2CG4]|uniref:ATP-binding cassette domain-containing protein n=1 Tax=Halovulum marinum TaxID=2662447 RepID=A0A6L5YV60_9RHOB|nr:ABC transporter ATP-binding protein [Halovulum marinum]MSU88306.1 ATP-binding cassette domain-containing protein [Halovulum marinum]